MNTMHTATAHHMKKGNPSASDIAWIRDSPSGDVKRERDATLSRIFVSCGSGVKD
jgi:hypothetical protein